MDLISFLQFLGAPKIHMDVRRHRRMHRVLASVDESTGPHVPLGVAGGVAFNAPLAALLGHALVSGATGAGKSMAAVVLTERLRSRAKHVGIGLIDGKGDTFEHLRTRLVDSDPLLLDFSANQVTPYGLLEPCGGETSEQLMAHLVDVFDDVLGGDDRLSLRMGRLFRNVLTVAVENRFSFPLVESLLERHEACRSLGLKCRSERVRAYFDHSFERERNTTLPALLARLEFVLRNERMRLSFGSRQFPDFRKAMDAGTPILVNTGGPGMSRAVGRLLQSLVLSDLRRAVFARENREVPYMWFLDEAQTLFNQKTDVENLTALLTMSRSFGAHLVLMTQSVVASCPDRDFLNQLRTNVRWVFMFRSGTDDARLIEEGLPVTGRASRFRSDRGRMAYLSEDQERRQQLREITTLPQRTAYLWLRASGRPAARVVLPTVATVRLADRLETIQDVSAEDINRDLEEQERRFRAAAGSPARRVPKSGAAVKQVLARLDEHLAARNG